MQIKNLQEAALACTTVAIKCMGNGVRFKLDLLEAMKTYDGEYIYVSYHNDYENRCLMKMALVIAFTTHHTELLNETLAELGFTPTPFIKKDKHPENKAAMWWIPARKLIEAVGYKPSHENIGKGK